jgi:superfamily II DNA or RNA helicase
MKSIPANDCGIYITIPLASLSDKDIDVITTKCTFPIEESPEPNAPAETFETPIWRIKNKEFYLPKAVLSELPEYQFEYTEASPHKKKLSLKGLEILPPLDPIQLEILNTIKEKNKNGMIQSAMGSGKSWLLIALLLGYPTLRPAVVSGKGKKDTKQLLEKLKELFKTNPDYAEKIMVSGLGRKLSKSDKEVLSADEGIIVCTHAGLQNIPENTQLLLLDEVHTAASRARISKILRLKEVQKIHGLSATINLRRDGGDQLLHALIGEVLIKKEHKEIEASGRVSAMQIYGYHFIGKGIYSVNPHVPEQEPPGGYSIHNQWVENHPGRHNFIADLILSLSHQETKMIFVPHIQHGLHLASALERKLFGKGDDISKEERRNYNPVIIHSKADKNDKHYLSEEEREARIQGLIDGTIKCVITTDALSTGFDTNIVDHIVDASGQMASITNIQRSGRSIRQRIKPDGSPKIAELHIVLDKTHFMLHKTGEKKFKAICEYYGHKENVIDSNRLGGVVRHIYPPWIPVADRIKQVGHNKKLNFSPLNPNPTFVNKGTFNINSYKK